MPQWTIKSVSNEPICTVKSVERHGQLMSGRWLTVDIDSPIALPLSAGCYIDFNNVRYSIRSQADVEKSARPQSNGGAFTYKDLRLDDVSWQELEDTQMCDYVYGDNHLHYSGLGTFSFYAVNASDVGYRVLANLANKYGDSAWDVRINRSSIKSDYTDYTFDEAKSIGISSGTSVKECLDLLWSNWGVYYTVENHVVDIITSSNGVSIPLRYGKNNGLKSIRRKINQNVEICTRVRAYGSERNMPYKWYNNKYNSVFGDAMYVPQLMLPHYAYIKSQNEIEFIDENGDLYDDRPPHYQYNLWATPSDIVLPSNNDIIQKYGKRDKEVHWNSDEMGEIFPSMKGMTSDDIPALREIYGDHFPLDHLLSTAVNEDGTPITGTGDTSELTTGKINFKVRVPNPGFDPMSQKGQEDVVLLMQSGMCQSRGFVILKSEAVTDNEQVVAYDLTCVKAIDDEIDQVFPNVNYTINGGDEYVYTGLTFSGNDLSNSWLSVYIGAAEKRLLRAAALWLREHQTEQYVYEITPDNVYLQRKKDEAEESNEEFDIIEGDTISLSQDDLGDSDEVVETVTVVYGKETIPTYEITFLKRDESESLGDRVKGLVGQTISVDSDIAKMNDSLYRKVNKAGFHTLFDPLDAQYNVLDINGDLSTLRYIRANVDFFGVSGVTALGRSSGGGGGGGSADLNALLDSINGSSIGNTLPTLSENGKCPVWVQTTENDGHWEWGTTGGGGGTGTLPNDIAYWDDDDGTVIYVDENGNVVSLAEYAKKTWVQEQIAQIPSSSFNEAAMWTALGTNDSTKLIDDSHISATIKDGAAAGARAIQQSDLNTALGSYYTKTEADGLFVHLTGDETIDGIKTFNGNYIVATKIKIGNAYISYNSNGLCIDDGNGGSMNLYATGGVSSLGVGSSGSGGASSLSELSDVNISSPIDGQGLVYDSATQKWVNGTVSGGGGGISLADVWTSLAANNTSNKIHFSHLPNTIHVVDALHIDEYGYIENSNNIRFDLPNKSSGSYTLATTADIQNIDLTDYALRSWVEGKNYLTGNQTITLSGDVSGSGTTTITTTIGTGRVTNAMLAGNIANSKLLYSRITIGNTSVSLGGTLSASALLNDLDDTFDGRYVTRGTEQEITASKTFKSTASLTVEASLTASNDIYLNKEYNQQWVVFNNNKKNFSFGQEIGGDCVLYAAGNVNFYTNVNGNPYALFVQGSSGNVGIGNNNPTYKFDVSGNINTTTGYYLDGKLMADSNNGLNIGYGFAAADTPLSTTIWGEGISFRSTDGTNNYTYGGCTKIDDTHGNVTYGIMATDFIGVTNKFRFEYDLQNNTVWVLKADGTAVNFASLGGVTSLGVGASGTPNISSMNIATLMTTNTTVGNQLNIGTSGTNDGQINFYDTDATDNASIAVNGGDLHITSDSTTYIDSLLSVDGNITADGEVKGTSLHTSGGNLTMGGGNILMGGGRIYLDATRYLYLNGSSLMYYNGTSSINVA